MYDKDNKDVIQGWNGYTEIMPVVTRMYDIDDKDYGNYDKNDTVVWQWWQGYMTTIKMMTRKYDKDDKDGKDVRK